MESVKMDRRVRRTREILGDALIALIQEKPFESITVQHVLDRAGVGRSTFYAHYRDKNDLFLSDVEDFLEHMAPLLLRNQEASNRVAPLRELCEHVSQMRQLLAALVAADKMRDFMELAQGHFARAIEQRLADLPASRAIAVAQRKALAQALAGAMLSLLSWWVDQDSSLSPEDIDHLYHQMVWSGINLRSVARDSTRRGGK
jgi:AcrR family transcriptional regulator